ncbi:MAG: pyridoxamine kinase [Lachnospiraceae bacterium]
MKKPVKKIVLLHDLCGVGKAALTNMLPILGVMGIEACPIPTMLLSTHTGGYGQPAIAKTSAHYIKECANHYVAEKVNFDAIFIGYIGTEELVDAVLYFISCFPQSPVILDPIMGDHGVYYRNFDEKYGKALGLLLPYADVVIPNLTEFCILSGIPFSKIMKIAQLQADCKKLPLKKNAAVIITSIPTEGHKKGILLYAQGAFTLLTQKEVPFDYHGTGDAFDGVFTGAFLNENTLMDCITKAHEFVCACILESAGYGYQEREGLMIEKNLYMLV